MEYSVKPVTRVVRFLQQAIRLYVNKIAQRRPIQLKSKALYIACAGFTLIELMVVVVIMAILVAIAIPSYQYYIQKRDLAVAQQEALSIAAELEKFKAKNFSYKGFDATYLYASAYNASSGSLVLPFNSEQKKYTLTLLDLDTAQPLTIALESDGSETEVSQSVVGLNWMIHAEREKNGTVPIQPTNYDFLITSTGLKCKSQSNNAFSDYDAENDKKCSDIDANSEIW